MGPLDCCTSVKLSSCLELKFCVVSLFIRTAADKAGAVWSGGAFAVPAYKEDVSCAVRFFYDDCGAFVAR